MNWIDNSLLAVIVFGTVLACYLFGRIDEYRKLQRYVPEVPKSTFDADGVPIRAYAADPNAKGWKATVDGREVPYGFAADREEGWVNAYATGDDGKPFIAGNQVACMLHRGRVEFERVA